MDQDTLNYKACPFVNVGDTKVKLSDITVVGYEDEVEVECFGIRMLSKSGATPKINGTKVIYWWVDDGVKKGWQDENEEWMEDDASDLGNADEIEFASGDGLVVYVKKGYTDCQLMCNGQVVTAKTVKSMSRDTLNYLGNPLARSVKLSEMYADGYEDELEVECFGIRMLSKSGATPKINGTKVIYWWVDDGEKSGWQDENEEWMEDDASDLGNADEIEFAAGAGVTVYVKKGYTDCQLNFPSLEGAK